MNKGKMLIYILIIIILVITAVMAKMGWINKITINSASSLKTMELASNYKLHKKEHQEFVNKLLGVNYMRSIKISRGDSGKFNSEFHRCKNIGNNSFDCTVSDEVSQIDQDYIYNFLTKFNYTTLQVTNSNGPEGYNFDNKNFWVDVFIGNDSAMLQYSPNSKDLFTIDWRHETPKKIDDHWFLTNYKHIPNDRLLR